MISRRRRAAEQGYDGAEIDDEIVTDNGNLIEMAVVRAIKHNSRYPEQPVTWQQILNPYGGTPATTLGEMQQGEIKESGNAN